MARIFGLIGYPLGHSWSKKYFSQKFEKEAITDARYETFPIEDLSFLQELLEGHPDLVGLNVTIPYKEKVIPYLDELDETATKAGAVNNIKISREKGKIRLTGFNADVTGFESSLFNNNISLDRKALVLGSGGASRAVRFVLEKHNCPYLVVSRTPKDTNFISYKQINGELLKSHSLIVNTTPLGMFPNIDSAPDIPYAELTANNVLFDVIYNPTETLFLKKGKESGCKIVNGVEMLELQAEASWKIWNQGTQE